jgi:hypothetical protein
MVALTLDSAKNIALLVALGFILLAVVSAVVIKQVTTKLLMVIVMGGLGILVWSQRSSLQDCAQRVKDRGVSVGQAEVTCSFFGSDVKVPAR